MRRKQIQILAAAVCLLTLFVFATDGNSQFFAKSDPWVNAKMLSQQLSSQDSKVQDRALNQLIYHEESVLPFVKQVIPLTASPKAEIRRDSIRALGKTAVIPEKVIPKKRIPLEKAVEERLVAALGDPDASVRSAAVSAFIAETMPSQAITDRILSMIQDPDGNVQYLVLCFLRRHEDRRKSMLPQLLPLLDSKAERRHWISNHFSTTVPLAKDVAMFIAEDRDELDDAAKGLLKTKMETTTDIALKVTLALVLDPKVAPLGPVDWLVHNIAQSDAEDEQYKLFGEIAHTELIDSTNRLRLLVTLSRAKGKIGHQAAMRVMELQDEWFLAREELVKAAADGDVRDWLKMAIEDWVKNNSE